MTSYLYELPTTGAISFTDFCIDTTASYTTDISDANQARANLRASLKESKHSDSEKDYLRLVKVGPVTLACNTGVSDPHSDVVLDCG